MKMTNFKSQPNAFGIFLGFVMVCLLSFSSGLSAQNPTTYGLPPLKTKADFDRIATEVIEFLKNDRNVGKNCVTQDPTAPCVKRFQALMEAYVALQSYMVEQPWMTEYELLRAIYPITNMHSLAVVSTAVNMDGFNEKKYNPYFEEILLRLKI